VNPAGISGTLASGLRSWRVAGEAPIIPGGFTIPYSRH